MQHHLSPGNGQGLSRFAALLHQIKDRFGDIFRRTPLTHAHYTRILRYIKPDFVHVFVDGRVAEEATWSLTPSTTWTRT